MHKTLQKWVLFEFSFNASTVHIA